MMVCVCLDACGVMMMCMCVCVCRGGGSVETGRSVDRMGELRRKSVRVKRIGAGLLGSEMELHALTLSHTVTVWRFHT